MSNSYIMDEPFSQGECPICGKGIQYSCIKNIEDEDTFIQVCRCPLCSEVFVLVYEINVNRDYVFKAKYPPKNFIKELPEFVKDISHRFCDIYIQAEKAYNNGLLEICGSGYRKALEILIKDYLIKDNCRVAKLSLDNLKEQINKLESENDKKKKFKEINSKPIIKYIKGTETDASNVVLQSTLHKCIEYCVSDPRIKDCAHQARCLGNNETHYEKIIDGNVIDELRLLIDLTLNWIETETLTEKFKNKYY